ncbi:ubiquitin thioesterase OTU1 [Galendromus occidentalis]|uniref:Ubiquitin thioesterase OTU n=1 Tax=Galendromus occidentalis TaxID=34638 RepID=A0AAJ7L2E7_9ACAR|nr:ubiquitin thioesterase OTU1 [Galendromus occidentalis]
MSSSKQLMLRIRTREGQHRIDCLTSDSTLAELKAVLLSLTGELVDRVLAGYPPSAISLDQESRTLEEAQVRSGDTLTVESPSTAGGASGFSMKAEAKPTEESNQVAPSTFDAGSNTAAGILMRRVVPSNNSCLFTSVYFGISGGKFDIRAGADLRQIIAEAVASDPITYSEAFLGKPNREYCTWILNEDHWGGAIELAILSKHFQTEMVAVDTQNVRLNRFGEDENYSRRILLIYDGIHYDPLMLESLEGNGQVTTSFDINDTSVLQMALELAREAKMSRQFTDVQNFTLRCLVCNKGVVGQTGAQAHAKSTGHTNFGEV